ncbi:nucleotidyltransferase domain-containing protein [Neobacillus niacini]|uniref:nucleotidyltransferase domain-containing protein n=1 Tax=Neobacillus niacini TaxID=86668 RepID=UPI003B012275
MRTDFKNWKPLNVSNIVSLFSEIPITWCLAGGWALDIHLGKKSREHSDIDVIILRDQHQAAFQLLSREWKVFKAEGGVLLPWNEGEYLAHTTDVWVSKSHNSSWAFQIMLVDTEDKNWIYRREKSIKKPVNELIVRTYDGIPYLRPEIQLLYKGGSSKIRGKDFDDLQTTLPILTSQEKEWLSSSLLQQFPQGHPWVAYLQKGI